MTLAIGKKLIRASILSTSMVSALAAAGTVVEKPGAPLDGANFGNSVARFGSYTAVGAQQESVTFPGEQLTQPNAFVQGQGAVYLFNGTSTSAERVYQFPGDKNYFKMVGAKVAISNKWLAFGATEPGDAPSAVYIVGKTNNQWTQCPTVNSRVDCASMVKLNGTAGSQSILRINFPKKVQAAHMRIAISDSYLVMADPTSSLVYIYRHDATQNRWVQEFHADDLDERYLGSAVAIDGDKVAISAPFNDGYNNMPFEAGTVRVFKRNSAGQWNVGGSVYGHFTSGNFGSTLDMHSGNLIIGSGTSEGDKHLTFFRVDANGALSAQTSHLMPSPLGWRPLSHVAVHGDTAIASISDPERALRVFKRDAATNTWKSGPTIPNDMQSALYVDPLLGAHTNINSLDLSGDDIVLGWSFYKRQGAIIRERASEIDSCKSTLNLVGNCSFDNNGSGWQFLQHQGASASVSFNNGQLNATINNPGSVHWHLQARTAVKVPEFGNYLLKFRARSTTFREITFNLGHNGSADNNWVSYARQVFFLNPDWTHYQLEFHGIPADANAFLDFNLGSAGTAPVTIDGVSLRLID